MKTTAILAALAHAPQCTANCEQGRRKCPVPDACRLVDEGEWTPLTRSEALVFWSRIGAVVALAVIAAVLLTLC